MSASSEIVEITLPRLGETMEEGRVVAWLKKPGEAVKRGEVLVEVETDKTVVEAPALRDGVLVEILAAEGAAVSVGAVIARMETAAGAVSGPTAPPRAPAVETTPAAAPAAAPEIPRRAARDRGDRLRASPRARRLARDAGIALDTIGGRERGGRECGGRERAGTGRGGRISGADVLRALESPAALSEAWTAADLLALRRWPAAGAGPRRGAVLLVHGLFADAAGFEPLARTLARVGFDVIAPDLPSHGETAAEARSFDHAAACLRASLSASGADGPLHLVGHSLGAGLAVRALQPRGDAVASVTLLAPIGFGAEINQRFLDGAVEARTPEALGRAIEALGAPALSPPRLAALLARIDRSRDGLRRLVADIAVAGVQQRDIAPDVAELAAPVCAVFAKRDRVIPWTQIGRAPARLRLRLLPEAGHALHVTASAAIAEAALEQAALAAGHWAAAS